VYWAYPQFAGWLMAALAFAGFAFWHWQRRRRGLRAFGLRASACGRDPVPAKLALRSLAVALAAVALLGPFWTEERLDIPTPPGRDVLVLLDVSRSMLAEDASPNRLEAARTYLREFAQHLQKSGANRIGLIAFADRPALLCPLTSDYAQFREELAEASLDSVRLRAEGPDGESGTQFRGALERAALASAHGGGDGKPSCTLLLVSDGGDQLDAAALEVARNLRGQGISLFALGVGDASRESPIPVRLRNGVTGQLRFEGQVVGVRLEETSLGQLAQETGGEYAPLTRTPAENLAGRITSQKGKQAARTVETRRPVLRFEWFLLPAVFLMLIDCLWRPGTAVETESAASGSPWLVRLIPQKPNMPIRKGA
jgi:Ca-activated chloride channel family protein